MHNKETIIRPWPRVLSAKLLSQYLSVSVATIRRRKDDIPGLLRMGTSLGWDRKIVDKWIAEATPVVDIYG